MAKKLISVRLSDNAIIILKTLSVNQDRSEAYIIEKLLESTLIHKKSKDKLTQSKP